MVFKYDTAGRLIEEVLTKSNGQVLYKETYRYDARGRLVEASSYEGENISVRRVYDYSGGERAPSEFVYYGRDGKIYERITYTDYEFNSRGDWVKRKESTEEAFHRKTVVLTSREIEYSPDVS